MTYLLPLCFLGAATLSCVKDKIELYESPARVFFNYAPATDAWYATHVDSVVVNIGKFGETERVIELSIKTMGRTSDVDRAVEVVTVTTGVRDGGVQELGTTAVEGTDFEIVEAVIPAGKIDGVIKVKLINTDHLTQATADAEPNVAKYPGLRIRLRIVENGNFRTDFVIEDEATGRSNLEYTVNYNNLQVPSLFVQSAANNTFRAIITEGFGAWSKVKFDFICQTLRLDPQWWDPVFGTSSGIEESIETGIWRNAADYLTNRLGANYQAIIKAVWIREVNRALRDYKTENGAPLLDENNQEVRLADMWGIIDI